ncbi:MoaD/ThiS family protein [Chloroflexota bacterium]
MGRVNLEILPWISDTFNGRKSGHLVLEEHIDEGATIGNLMRKLAEEHQAFGDVMFDTGTDRLGGHVVITLNDRFVESIAGLDTKIQDGDTIRLFPLIAGG